MRIRILKPDLTILGEVRNIGDIVNDPDPNECANLAADGRAEYLTDDENVTQDAKDALSVEPAAESSSSSSSSSSHPE